MIRIGHGYDIHQLVSGRDLIIGGVAIPSDKGLLGHSDADILVHAVIDAILGAGAYGDIGKFFPDSNAAYKDVSSIKLLQSVNTLISDDGYKIGNIDATVVIEKPKLRDYIDLMRANLARYLKVELDQINIKAKTNEQIGAVGNEEAAIAHAVVLLIK